MNKIKHVQINLFPQLLLLWLYFKELHRIILIYLIYINSHIIKLEFASNIRLEISR